MEKNETQIIARNSNGTICTHTLARSKASLDAVSATLDACFRASTFDESWVDMEGKSRLLACESNKDDQALEATVFAISTIFVLG